MGTPLRLQNQYAILGEGQPNETPDATMDISHASTVSPWDICPERVEEALHRLQVSYQRSHHLESPLDFDNANHVWKWADHHATKSNRAPQQYAHKTLNGGMQVGQVDLPKLLAGLAQFEDTWKHCNTVWLYVDNRPLDAQGQPSYWPYFSPWVRERCRWIGPYQEATTAAFIPSNEAYGLNEVHFTWAGTFVLEAAAFLYPHLNFFLADADCVPTSLFEMRELIHLAENLFPEAPRTHEQGAVLLVSEPHAEINAGLVGIGRRTTTRSPLPTNWTDAGKQLVRSRARFLQSSREPSNATEAAMSGLLLTPLLGCTAETSLDWCHAWAILGQWANFLVFPLPVKTIDTQGSFQWPRHAHCGKLNDNMQTRSPTLTGWARPAFEQGALPPLSLLPAKFPVCVLPGDKLFQSDVWIDGHMNPIIFHGFSGNKDKWGRVLQLAATRGILPMAACLLGTKEKPPLWQHARQSLCSWGEMDSQNAGGTPHAGSDRGHVAGMVAPVWHACIAAFFHRHRSL